MTEPLLSHLSYLTKTPEAQPILDGLYNLPHNLDPYTAKLLSKLEMPKIVKHNCIPAKISPKEHEQFWQGMDSSI
jgi:hypothetical protein